MRSRPTLVLGLCLVLTEAAPAAAQTVGVTAAVNQAARSIRPNAPIRTIALGDNVIHNERIETDTVGLLQILLADGTAFTVGPNSALAIDRFVYDPQAGTAQVAATLTKGVFRFIGGKTSKTPGGVSLGTPVGTIGIRGAVVDVSLAPNPGGGTPTHVDMIFGDEVTLTAPDGQTNRIYEPGYSIVITANADGAQMQSVQRTPTGFASAIQQSLAGAPGTSGGSPNRPSDGIVVASGVSAENSDRTPAINNPPIPLARPEPDRPRVLEATLIQDALLDVGREDVIADGGRTGNTGTSGGSGGGGGTESRSASLRLLTAGATYQTNTADIVQNPGRYGFVGGSPGQDRGAVLAGPAASGRGVATTNRGDLVLPVFSDPRFTARVLTDADGASLGGVPLRGTVYSGVDRFSAYALSLNGDVTQPVYALTGTPIVDDGVLRNRDVRTYSFTADMLHGVPVPFLSNTAVGSDFSGASISDFYLVESPSNNSSTALLQSWLSIKGNGLAQISSVGVNVGNLQTAEEGGLEFSFGRRGSFRSDPLGFSSQMSGAINTLGLAPGGNQIFGRNGENLVLTADSESNDYFANSDVFGRSTPIFSSLHVLSLADEKPLPTFSADRGATRQLQAIRGFAAGLIENNRSDTGYRQELATSGASPNAVSLHFSPNNTLGGEVEIASPDGSLSAHVAFGSGVNGNASGGRSAYVDDNLFAAANNGNETRTYSVDTGTRYPQIRGIGARTYLLAGDANPQPSLMPGGRLCDCKFLEWGWWGTQIRSSTDTTQPNSENFGTIRTAVHLGAWVAGDITTNAQLSALSGTTASFQGTAVGNVSQAVSGGLADYIASGRMGLSYDFGARRGDLSIDAFDGRSFSGTMSGGTGSEALFSGTLAQTNGNATGPANGAFVNDGASVAAGVIGDFSLQSQASDWAAAGIFGGARGPSQ